MKIILNVSLYSLSLPLKLIFSKPESSINTAWFIIGAYTLSIVSVIFSNKVKEPLIISFPIDSNWAFKFSSLQSALYILISPLYNFFIHWFPCSCGSINKGNFLLLVYIIAFSIDTASLGNPFIVHCLISTASLITFSKV